MMKSPEDTQADWPCLLCQTTEGRIVAQLTGKQLDALWQISGKSFSPQALGKITPDFNIVLKECGQCGFVSADPALAGGEQFYREVDSNDYFSTARQEFARTIDFARQHSLKRVLDVGCGSGIFLDQARSAGLQTHGLELNKAVAARTRSKGHQIFEGLLDELANTPAPPQFDLITFFQVVEHLADPVKVLKDAARLLAPSGYIAIAVPSATGVYRLVPWDPSQWPPHHVSRWRLADFEQLGQSSGLKVIASGGDQLMGRDIEFFWKMHNRLANIVGERPYPGGNLLPAVISFIYRKLGLKYIFTHRGSSVYAFFSKP